MAQTLAYTLATKFSQPDGLAQAFIIGEDLLLNPFCAVTQKWWAYTGW